MIRPRRPSLPSLFVVVLLTANLDFARNPVLAQAAGAISGVVRDSTGALLPGVAVTATNTSTGAERTTTTGTEGRYQITALAAH